MESTPQKFAVSGSDYEEADFVLVGVPYDKTACFRTGTDRAPLEVRRASYCFEPYLFEYDVDLNDVYICDHGDLDIEDDPVNMEREVRKVLKRIVEDGKFPIIIGGEHSLTSWAVSPLKEKHAELDVLVLDAHLDFRDTYEGRKRSHATVTHRLSEDVGLDHLTVAGVRSLSREEAQMEKRPLYFTADELKKDEFNLEKITEKLGDNVYLSIDMDVVDPSYAPGVGTPEPFGLEPLWVKKMIGELSDRLVGFDLMEINPKYDHGEITSNLGARFIYEVFGSTASI